MSKKIILAARIAAALINRQGDTDRDAVSLSAINLANDIAEAIDEYITECIVVVDVTTAGSPTAQAGKGTGKII